MLTRRHYICALLALAEPANAHALRHSVTYAVPGQTLLAAAVRVAAPFGTVTSTFRTVEHNRSVGGVEDSYHLLGQAIDIVRRRGVSHAQIAAALTAAGLHLIESLDEGTHSHFAFGPVLRKIPPPPLPLPPSVPRFLLAADQHGTLRADLGAKHKSRTRMAAASQSGREAVH